MTKLQFEMEIKKMVSNSLPNNQNGTFLKQLIFHQSTVVDWIQIAQLVKTHFPELRKRVEEMELDYEKSMQEETAK